jgi:Predicted transcriptional regulator
MKIETTLSDLHDSGPAALLLSDHAAAAWLGMSRATFWRRVTDGTFPQPIRIGRSTRWRRDELQAAVDALTAAQRGAA